MWDDQWDAVWSISNSVSRMFHHSLYLCSIRAYFYSFKIYLRVHTGRYTANNEDSAGSSCPGHTSDHGFYHPDWILCNTQRGYSMSCTPMPHPLPLSGEHQTILHIQHQNISIKIDRHWTYMATNLPVTMTIQIICWSDMLLFALWDLEAVFCL